tara:strand:+ start:49928 stop:50713 length:786 start_codon:yes stop_codon:yes gene_type:complete
MSNYRNKEEKNDLSDSSKLRGRGIYLLPNLFTTAALFSGFYAVLASMDGQFEKASLAIFLAMVLDGLDGRVARITNTQTSFGAQYDSLSDMVAFGLAPALVIYQWTLSNLGKIGWMAAFIFIAGAALRLARFNSQVDTSDRRFFTGLPSPSAAAVLAGGIWVAVDNSLSPDNWAWFAAGLTVICGLLMVSNFLYHSFKRIDFKGKVPFFIIVFVMLFFALVLSEPPIVLFLIFFGYTLAGPILSAQRFVRRRIKKRKRELL